jgi:hypothetical protein
MRTSSANSAFVETHDAAVELRALCERLAAARFRLRPYDTTSHHENKPRRPGTMRSRMKPVDPGPQLVRDLTKPSRSSTVTVSAE